MLISHKPSFVMVNSEDRELNVRIWTRLLTELNELDRPAIVDVSNSDDRLSEIDAYLVALEIDTLDRLLSHRLALVTPGDQNRSRFFAACARHRGLDIAVFDSTAEARIWIDGST